VRTRGLCAPDPSPASALCEIFHKVRISERRAQEQDWNRRNSWASLPA
jgi:hypothetical protein